MTWTIVAFYKFLPLPRFASLRDGLLAFCGAEDLCGSILLAPEGINGTVAGMGGATDALLMYLSEDLGLGPIEVKTSFSDKRPFRKTRVKLKEEIVHLGRPDLNPATCPVGVEVEPRDWNRLLGEPGVRVIDTRNDFEVNTGTFVGAENPGTERFSEFTD